MREVQNEGEKKKDDDDDGDETNEQTNKNKKSFIKGKQNSYQPQFDVRIVGKVVESFICNFQRLFLTRGRGYLLLLSKKKKKSLFLLRKLAPTFNRSFTASRLAGSQINCVLCLGLRETKSFS